MHVFKFNYIFFINRITGFLDSWPKLEKWFTKFGTLQRVDASQEQRTVVLEVDKILEDTVNRVSSYSLHSALLYINLITSIFFCH